MRPAAGLVITALAACAGGGDPPSDPRATIATAGAERCRVRDYGRWQRFAGRPPGWISTTGRGDDILVVVEDGDDGIAAARTDARGVPEDEEMIHTAMPGAARVRFTARTGDRVAVVADADCPARSAPRCTSVRGLDRDGRAVDELAIVPVAVDAVRARWIADPASDTITARVIRCGQDLVVERRLDGASFGEPTQVDGMVDHDGIAPVGFVQWTGAGFLVHYTRFIADQWALFAAVVDCSG